MLVHRPYFGMGSLINAESALKVLLEEAGNAGEIPTGDWAEKTSMLYASLPEDGSGNKSNLTFIAMLGTALLAKATNLKVNVLTLKSSVSVPGAYSARSLAKEVLAAKARNLRIDLGVHGREPLNNQPFYAEEVVSEELPVEPRARTALVHLVKLLKEVNGISTEREARRALREFISARRFPASLVDLGSGDGDHLTQEDLLRHIQAFVSENAENGKRAQAVAAGVLDGLAQEGRVVTGKINHPDRRLPLDIAIAGEDSTIYLRAFEVRHKRVTVSDLDHIVTKAVERGVLNMAVIAVGNDQPDLDVSTSMAYALSQGATLRVYFGWQGIVAEALFWSWLPGRASIGYVFRRIYSRSVELEVSAAAIERWCLLGKPFPQS